MISIRCLQLSLGLLLVTATHLPAQSVTGVDVPIAPLPPVAFAGWTNACRLANSALEVIIAPAVGRMVTLIPAGATNLLRLDPALAGLEPSATNTESWLNFGGDWFWPVAQSQWTPIQGRDWPPPPALAERPWQATAWKGADGGQFCQISREYDAPLNIRVTRQFKLDKERALLTIRQRIEQQSDSPYPVTPWNISQLPRADEIVLPVDTNSGFTGGFKSLMFAMPPSNILTVCAGAIVYDVGSGEHKLGSDSGRGWIAARRGSILVVERSITSEAGLPPDGGCTVEMYSNSGLGYSEIETLGPEKNLGRGQATENTLNIECFRLNQIVRGCELAAKVRELLGEQ